MEALHMKVILENEVLDLIRLMELNDDDYYLAKSRLEKILNPTSDHELHVAYVNEQYMVYRKDTKTKVITGKYKPDSKEEILCILIKELINEVVFRKLIREFEYARDIMTQIQKGEFKKKHTDEILSKLPECYREYCKSKSNVYDDFEDYLNSEAYKKWLTE